MVKIKKASVAGQFYTADKDALTKQLGQFVADCKRDTEATSRLVIAPHAGYIYSGPLMAESVQYLPNDVKNIFIIAPSHHVGFIGLALSSYEQWNTPIGNIDLNTDIYKILESEISCHYFDEAFTPEHAVEVEVPFVQYRFPEGVKIVPILVGQVVPGKIMEVLERFYDDPQNAFILSSDLSHFLTLTDARRLDLITAQMIESNDEVQFQRDQACGGYGIRGGLLFAQKRKYSFIRAGMFNSGDRTGDNTRVVGYGSWFLYEGTKEQYLKQYYSKRILEWVRKSISFGLNNSGRIDKKALSYIPAVFEEWGACFVTLELNGNLRGCIGSIIAQESFIDDLLANSWNAAFHDPRFHPLTQKEFEKIKISVSILSKPVPLKFKTEAEMLAQVRPFKDGLIISDGYQRAVYLPSVWEQLPDKEQFLYNLKIKAGMSPTHFSKTFQAHVFTTDYITED